MPRYWDLQISVCCDAARERLKISNVLFRICMTQIQMMTTRNPTPKAVIPGPAAFHIVLKKNFLEERLTRLRSLVAAKIKKMSQIDTSRVAINVVDQIVSITGSANL